MIKVTQFGEINLSHEFNSFNQSRSLENINNSNWNFDNIKVVFLLYNITNEESVYRKICNVAHS